MRQHYKTGRISTKGVVNQTTPSRDRYQPIRGLQDVTQTCSPLPCNPPRGRLFCRPCPTIASAVAATRGDAPDASPSAVSFGGTRNCRLWSQLSYQGAANGKLLIPPGASVFVATPLPCLPLLCSQFVSMGCCLSLSALQVSILSIVTLRSRSVTRSGCCWKNCSTSVRCLALQK